MRKFKRGFTLMEVLVSVAIAGLVISGGFRLIAMSYKLLGELQTERELISAAEKIWLRFKIDSDMPDNGTDDETKISWRSDNISIPIDDYELKYKRVTVTIESGRSTIIYVAE
ncbi:MAG: prepilin-type N-terminal cleavage/methylation domain-containing protein [Synergistaceae bacterium]|nr:prepilin-type N-terminal cleavage/methylation domain-containing protein [Synergistaceae bacterium]